MSPTLILLNAFLDRTFCLTPENIVFNIKFSSYKKLLQVRVTQIVLNTSKTNWFDTEDENISIQRDYRKYQKNTQNISQKHQVRPRNKTMCFFSQFLFRNFQFSATLFPIEKERKELPETLKSDRCWGWAAVGLRAFCAHNNLVLQLQSSSSCKSS